MILATAFARQPVTSIIWTLIGWHGHVLKDEVIQMTGVESRKIRENEQVFELITNQRTWTANIIGELCKGRWQIKIFFHEINQLLHIKSFIGTTENAVLIQIWTALITILVLKALKAMAKQRWYLSNLVGLIRLNLLVKIDLEQWLDHPFDSGNSSPVAGIQEIPFLK